MNKDVKCYWKLLNSDFDFHLQLPLYLVVVPTSSLAITHDASRHDLSAILIMTARMAPTNMQIAHNRLAVPLSLPATTNAVFWQSGNVMAIMIVVIWAMSEIAVSIISKTRDSVSSHFKQRREVKIRPAAEFFRRISRSWKYFERPLPYFWYLLKRN